MAFHYDTEHTHISTITPEDGLAIHVAVMANRSRLEADFPQVIGRYGTVEVATRSAGRAAEASQGAESTLEAMVVRERDTNRLLGIATLMLLDHHASLVLAHSLRPVDLLAGWEVADSPSRIALEVGRVIRDHSGARLKQRGGHTAISLIREQNEPSVRLAIQLGMHPRHKIGNLTLRAAGFDDGVAVKRRLWARSIRDD